MIRELTGKDASDAIALYRALNPKADIGDTNHFETLIAHDDITILGAEIDGRIVAMATLYLLANMTYGGRPFGVIENVITLMAHRNKGLMRRIIQQLQSIAWEANAYKIMLMTGTDSGAKSFYEKLGYSANSKHGLQIRQAPPRNAN